MDIAALAQAAEQKFGLPSGIMSALIHQESRGNPKAVSPKGALGLTQLMPATAKEMGVDNPMDPEQNVMGGARYLSQQMQRFGNTELALAAYNAGPENVAKAGGVPDNQETPLYVSNIMANMPEATMTPAAIDPSKVQWDDAPTQGASHIDPSKVVWDDGGGPAASAAPAAPQRSATQQIKHQLGLTARAAGHGIADALGVVGNPINAAINAVGGAFGHDPHLQDVDTLLKGYVDANTPAPENKTEQVVGNVASTMANPIAMATGGAVGPAANIGQAVGKGAVAGLLGAASQPVHGTDTAKDLAIRALTGAAGGGVAGGAANALGRVVGGLPLTDAARRLMARGITPMPGQAVGGAAGQIEEKLGSLPFLGEAQAAAQRQNIDKFNRTLYQNALAPVRGQLPADVATGSEGLASVHDQIGSEFNDIANQVPSFKLRGAFVRDVSSIRNNLAQTSPASLPQFDSVLENQIAGKLGQGQTMTGSQWGDTRSFLSGLSRNNRLGNTNPDQRALADAVDQLNDSLTNQVNSQTGGAVADKLSNANAAYARYKQIERAAGSTGAFNNGNVLTPAQYAASVRAGATASQRAGATQGMNAQLAQDAQQVLGRKYPDSGTAGRLLINGAALGALGGTEAHDPGFIARHPIATALIAAGIPAYGTQAGRQAMLTLLSRRPELLQQIGGGIAGAAPLMGVLGGSAASQ